MGPSKGDNMRHFIIMVMFIGYVSIVGCETAKKGTTAAGNVVGKGADVVGGVTEGAADGYKGKDVTADNPYGREIIRKSLSVLG